MGLVHWRMRGGYLNPAARTGFYREYTCDRQAYAVRARVGLVEGQGRLWGVMSMADPHGDEVFMVTWNDGPDGHLRHRGDPDFMMWVLTFETYGLDSLVNRVLAQVYWRLRRGESIEMPPLDLVLLDRELHRVTVN